MEDVGHPGILTERGDVDIEGHMVHNVRWVNIESGAKWS
jgi:hypothetical protein